MSFPPYPKYNESGVQWLGSIPQGWTVQRIKNLFEIKKRIAGQEGFDVLSITQKGLKVKDIDANEGQLAADYSNYQFVEPGDFAMNHMDLLTGWIDVATMSGVTSPDYRVFSLRDPNAANRRYFLHVFQTAYRERILYALGQGASQLGRWRLPADQFYEFALPYPPIDEQEAIATVLDSQTAATDALLGEQRRLIELLQEKQQAVISHAVTNGLNPNAPMKPSGIDWLGQIPTHWSLAPLKRVASIRYGIGEPPPYYEEGVPLIRATNVSQGKLHIEGMVYVNPAEIAANRIVWLSAGDIIVVRSGAYTGDSAIIPHGYGKAIAGFDMVLRCDSVRPKFLQFALLSDYLKKGQIDLERMRAAQPHLNAEELGACVLVLPSVTEQDEIVAALEPKLLEFEDLIREAEGAIEFLQERRSALISAAVTGKIDVRNAVPEYVA
jgi:type I restriction enzyme S subunit